MVRRRIDRADGVERVSFIELFFDLVFVFAITQLSDTLQEERSGAIPRGDVHPPAMTAGRGSVECPGLVRR